MVNLPTEIIHQIIHEYRKTGGDTRLRRFSAINRNWQTVVEDYTWHYLHLSPQEIGCFRSAFRGNPRRRQVLRRLNIRFEGYFARVEPNMDEQHSADESGGDEDSDEESYCAPCCQVCPRGECKSDRTTFPGDETLLAEDCGSSSRIRLAAAQDEHARFFREVKAIWDELASWEDDLRVEIVFFDVAGFSLYNSLGPDVCSGDFSTFTLLEFSSLPRLPLLPSVKSLWVTEETNEEIDLWPTVVTCSVASSLPALECLKTVGSDYELQWPVARRSLRHDQILKLPVTLKTLYVCLEYGGIRNHEVHPPNFLRDNLDSLSRSIRHASTHLTTLAIRVSSISAALFWDPDAPATSLFASWPNLRILDISTSLERSSGDYWLRPAANYPEHELYDWPDPKTLNPDYDNEEDLKRDQAVGAWPARRFLTRPQPEFFDELAMSLARAVTCMPKLEYLDLEFNASHQGELKPDVTHFHRGSGHKGGLQHTFHQYEGWTFYFRASNESRFASKYSKLYWFEHEPGIDRTNIERPRTEWVFQCPFDHLSWEEPEAAKVLWREKCPQIDFDVVALDGAGTSWERHRNGNLVPLLGMGFATTFPGRPDLDEVPERFR